MGQPCIAEGHVCGINPHLDRNRFYALVISRNDDLGYLIEACLLRKGVNVYRTIIGDNWDQTALPEEIKIIIFDAGPMTDHYRTVAYIHKLRSDFTRQIVCIIPPLRPDAKLQCLAAGADFVLEKPLTADNLLNAVGMVINSCGLKTSSGGS